MTIQKEALQGEARNAITYSSSIREKTEYTLKCEQRLKAVILEHGETEAEAIAEFFKHCISCYSSISSNCLFYRLHFEHIDYILYKLWAVCIYGNPIQLKNEKLSIPPLDEYIVDIMGDYEDYTSKFDVDHFVKVQSGCFEALKVYAHGGYSTKDIIKETTFLQKLADVFSY